MSVFIPNTSGVYISTAISLAATSDLTLLCWTYLSATTPAAYRDILSLDPNVFLQTGPTGLTFNCGTFANDHLGPAIAANTWYHMAYVCRSSSASAHQIRGYLNGQQVVDVASDNSVFGAFTAVTVGNSTAQNTLPLNGLVRDVRVFTRALTPTEVVREMESAIPVSESLFLWAPLDSDIVNDKSPYGRRFTATGAGILTLSGPLVAHSARRRQSLR